jgi:hypothetical protein
MRLLYAIFAATLAAVAVVWCVYSARAVHAVRHALFFGLTTQSERCLALLKAFEPSRNAIRSSVPPFALCSVEIPFAAFYGFVDQEIIPRFPDGFSVMDSAGFYASRSDDSAAATISEKSKVLVVYAPYGDASVEARLEEIVGMYRWIFGQDAVLWTKAAASEVSFNAAGPPGRIRGGG